ncbi:MAG: FAD-binding protein, partial [Oscillochloris sp.]|nr:FAD-binding protein [Oscillochloris sp.]
RPAGVARQTADLHATAQAAGAVPTVAHASAWARWEALAASQRTADLALELTLPRAALPAYIAAAHASARRHGRSLALWGDAGLGALYLQLDGPADPAGRRCLAILASLAQAVGGDLSSELGRPEAQGHTTGSPPHAAADKTMPPATRRQPIPPQSALPALRAAVGQRWLLTRPDELATYTLDASIAQPSGLPLAVALPANIAELVDLMQIAAAHGLPVVGRGAGSGLAGGATPSASALVIGLSRMNRITIDRRQRVAHVGAGSITADLQRAATAARLFYPPDPSSQSVSTIGGNIACNAGGPRCVKYGVTADYVLGLTAVLADGSLVRWGDGLTGQGPTSSLCQLLVGSEGSLAIIAEATLRLLAQPASQHTTMAIFPTLEAACSAVEQIMAAGIVPAGLELMDDTTMAAVEAYLQIGLPRAAGAMLLMFADGEPEAVATEAQAMADLAWRNGALQVQAARNPAEEALLWRGRRAIAPALARIRPSRLGEDISVPLPQIAAFVRRVSQISAAHRLPIAVFGHAGDGNLHPNILFDPRDPSEQARLWPCAEAIVGAALDLGGTLSGEHGVGTLKRAFLPQALGGEALALQRRIKARLDPQGRLNPGKIFPDLP